MTPGQHPSMVRPLRFTLCSFSRIGMRVGNAAISPSHRQPPDTHPASVCQHSVTGTSRRTGIASHLFHTIAVCPKIRQAWRTGWLQA
jgi:hypothetical protein